MKAEHIIPENKNQRKKLSFKEIKLNNGIYQPLFEGWESSRVIISPLGKYFFEYSTQEISQLIEGVWEKDLFYKVENEKIVVTFE